VGTKSEACHAANNVTREIKEHVSRKGVLRMCDQGPLGREAKREEKKRKEKKKL